MTTEALSELAVRQARSEDAELCGSICFEAFDQINRRHGFPCDFPAPEVATAVLKMMFSHPKFYCVVAESQGRVVGSNCLDERSIIAGVGPITIDPQAQNRGIGMKLMNAVLRRAADQRVAGVRLIQAAFHNRSLSLYARLGFDVREPLACMQGRTMQRRVPGCAVRPAQKQDIEVCNALSRQVHGFDRGQELTEAVEQGTAVVVERGGEVSGYASSLSFFGHATAETNVDLQALIASAESFGGPGILVPARNNALFRWCLANGLRVVQPLTLMTRGLYNEPAGAWLSSIMF